MINTKYLLLASACVLLSGSSQASEVKNLTFDYSGSPLVKTTYTTHTPMELKPISSFNSDNAVKLAAVCSVTGECNGMGFDSSNNKMDFDNAYLCREDGYTLSSCPENYIKGAACPLDKKYIKECISPETWCKNNGYAVTKCTLPAYPETACPHSSAYYKSCKTDNVRACKEDGYSLVCDTGKVRDGNQICAYDDSYSKCVCDPCVGFNYTIAQASEQGYVPGEICNSCGTIKYKREENSCEGYKTCDCGGEVGADVCYSGTQQKFSTCKECCDTSVYKYDASNCSGDYQPTGNSCGNKFDKCIKPGLILYSDRSTSRQYLPEKTAIGVVIDEDKKIAAAINNFSYNQTKMETCKKSSSNGQIRDALTGEYRPLTEEEIDLACRYLNVNAIAPWGNSDQDEATQKDIPDLENCDECSLTCTVASGKENTTKIIAYGQSQGLTFEAAEFAYNYQPEAGCSSGSWCSSGNWYLPSIHELKTFYDNKTTIKKTLHLIPGSQQIIFDSIKSGYMTSTETFDSNPYRQNGSCMFYMETGKISFAKKNFWEGFILPMIKY